MIDFSTPLDINAVAQIVVLIVAAVGFFYGLKNRLASVEASVSQAVDELHGMRESLVDIAKHAVKIEMLEKEVDRLRAEVARKAGRSNAATTAE